VTSTANNSILDQIDAALRLVDREVWVVTAAAGSCRGGLLATWVSSASIDRERPVLLAGIGPNHFTAELVQTSKAFAAHLLRIDQIELAWNFASGSGRDRDKLAGLALEKSESGSPILADCLAWLDCRVFARYDAGDRLFFWGDIVAGTLRVPLAGAGTPTRFAGAPVPTTEALREHEFFRHLTHQQRQTLIADRQSDVALNRRLHEQWRLSVGRACRAGP
jgi:flavin reductase (DIM6/NTAB) family NADH-FMN oxidoreductase RutF